MASSAPVLCKDEQGAKLLSGLPTSAHWHSGTCGTQQQWKGETRCSRLGQASSSMFVMNSQLLKARGMPGAHSVTSASFPT